MFLWAQAGSAVPTWLSGKEFTCNVGGWGFDPWVEKIPWRRKWQPTPVFLPEKFHGKRSLLGYSPWDCKRVEHDLVNKQQQQPFNLIYPCFSPLPVPRWWPPFYSLLLCTQLSYAYRFLRRQVRWSGIPISFKIFQFVVIHTVKGFNVVNKAEVDFF